MIRREMVMIRRGNMKFLTSLSGENPGSGDRPLLSHGLKGDAGNQTNSNNNKTGVLVIRQILNNNNKDNMDTTMRLMFKQPLNRPCCSFIIWSLS